MCNCKRTFGAVLIVPDVQAASNWLCENLFFVQVQAGELCNGDCTLYLEQGTSCTPPPPSCGSYHTGLAHIALAAASIDEALDHCQGCGLSLQTQNGKSFFNAGVFGEGEWYFNILTPFGVVIEIAQRQASPLKGTTPICGLDHLGVPCSDFKGEVKALERLGFTSLFAPVHNYNQTEGHIICCMLSDGSVTLEAYQFLDMIPCPPPEVTALRGICSDHDAVTPGGLHFLRKGEAS